MNACIYFCLVAAKIVATFVIGYNIGTDKQSKKNNSQTNAKVIEKEGYWLQSVEGYIVVFEMIEQLLLHPQKYQCPVCQKKSRCFS